MGLPKLRMLLGLLALVMMAATTTAAMTIDASSASASASASTSASASASASASTSASASASTSMPDDSTPGSDLPPPEEGSSSSDSGSLPPPPDEVNCRFQTFDPRSNRFIHFPHLGKIRPTNETSDFIAVDLSNDDYIAYFRICEPVVLPCASKPDAATENTDAPASIEANTASFCEYRTSTASSTPIGRLSSMEIHGYPSADKTRGVLVSYRGGDSCFDPDLNIMTTYQVLITIECDPQLDVPLTHLTASNHLNRSRPCSYTLSARSPYACPESSSEEEPLCEAQTDCASCAKLPNCGWCSTTRRCNFGSSLGPLDYTCNGTRSWIFGSNDKCVDCSAITSCSSCSSSPDCIYCSKTGCIPLSEKGNCSNILSCSCDQPCNRGYYCPPEGGKCHKVPSTAGLFIGGMIFSLVLVVAGFFGLSYARKRGMTMGSVLGEEGSAGSPGEGSSIGSDTHRYDKL
ncbi:hypothetical protein H696_00977 [Fonticula alba]|uniref:MRH domain-containing protein n=1 Tax=Fonticula alba TaxID=691883 RepID=A0A058ZHJ9_FONAL|nr:hypothetical protein H696_00977 [Fonticula alba]KCV73441.1 hypothetical protein H696_00977 [Fonticula alba]|eukprot:XP_009493142.1 hypothetical protein H696_00977 [Fonticula alba]